jgi:hypothetical protein
MRVIKKALARARDRTYDVRGRSRDQRATGGADPDNTNNHFNTC